jgi:hypothetical protein
VAAHNSSRPSWCSFLPIIGLAVGLLTDIKVMSPGAAYGERLSDAFLPDDQAVRHNA